MGDEKKESSISQELKIGNDTEGSIGRADHENSEHLQEPAIM